MADPLNIADTLRSEVVEKFPALRSAITEKLISTFGEIKSGKVFRGAMWIVGEYCEGATGASQVSSWVQTLTFCRDQAGDAGVPQGHRRDPHPGFGTSEAERNERMQSRTPLMFAAPT